MFVLCLGLPMNSSFSQMVCSYRGSHTDKYLGHLFFANMEDNNTRNGTTTVFIWQVYLSFTSLLCITIVAGNVMTILAVWKTETLRTITNKFVINLALADLIMSYSLVLVTIGRMPIECTIRSSKLASLSSLLFNNLSILMSFFSLCLIAMDRYMFIGFPLHYHRLMTSKRANIIILSSWTVAVVYCGLLFCWNDERPAVDCNNVTVVMPTMYQAATIVIYFAIYFIMMTFYGKILLVILRQRRSIRDLVASSQGNKSSSDLNFIKVMLSVVGVSTFCWMPLGTISIVNMCVHTHYGTLAARYLSTLIYVNSAVNFFIYAAKDKKFRCAYKKLLCRK